MLTHWKGSHALSVQDERVQWLDVEVGHPGVARQREERQHAPHPLDRVGVVDVHMGVGRNRPQFFVRQTVGWRPRRHGRSVARLKIPGEEANAIPLTTAAPMVFSLSCHIEGGQGGIAA